VRDDPGLVPPDEDLEEGFLSGEDTLDEDRVVRRGVVRA
jgi:hypothetical protein